MDVMPTFVEQDSRILSCFRFLAWTGEDQPRNLAGVSLDLAGEASADQLQVTSNVNVAGPSPLLFLNLVSSVLFPRLHRHSVRCQKVQCSPCKVAGFHALEIQ